MRATLEGLADNTTTTMMPVRAQPALPVPPSPPGMPPVPPAPGPEIPPPKPVPATSRTGLATVPGQQER